MGGFAEEMNGAALDIHERYAGHHLVNGVSVRGKHAERIRFILWFAEDFILVHDGIRGDNQAFAEFLGANFPIAGFGFFPGKKAYRIFRGNPVRKMFVGMGGPEYDGDPVLLKDISPSRRLRGQNNRLYFLNFHNIMRMSFLSRCFYYSRRKNTEKHLTRWGMYGIILRSKKKLSASHLITQVHKVTICKLLSCFCCGYFCIRFFNVWR